MHSATFINCAILKVYTGWCCAFLISLKYKSKLRMYIRQLGMFTCTFCQFTSKTSTFDGYVRENMSKVY